MAQPSFKMMWDAFPDHTAYPTLRDLFTYIGGQLAKNIDEPGFGPAGNTCAARMSRALNYGNFPVSGKICRSLKLNPVSGGDKKLYLFRVKDLRLYLEHAMGARPQIVTKNFTSAFPGKSGIVAFKIDGWTSASGHIALWDGSAFKEPDHDDYRAQTDDPATTVNEGTIKEMALWAF